MSFGSTTSNTETNTTPWVEQQPYLKYVFDEAARLYGQAPPTGYQGPTKIGTSDATRMAQQGLSNFWGYDPQAPVAPWATPQTNLPPPPMPEPEEPDPSPDGGGTDFPGGDGGQGDGGSQDGGQGAESDAGGQLSWGGAVPLGSGSPPALLDTLSGLPPSANGSPSSAKIQSPMGSLGQNLLGQERQAVNFGLSGVLNPESNRYLNAYVDSALSRVRENLLEQALPAVRNEAIASGNLGSSRQGIAEGLAISRAGQTGADLAANIYNNAYGQGLNVFQSTLAGLPQFYANQTRPFTDLSAVGAQQEGYAQADLTDSVNQYNEAQLAPYRSLEQFLSFVGGGFGGSGYGAFTGPQSLLGSILG